MTTLIIIFHEEMNITYVVCIKLSWFYHFLALQRWRIQHFTSYTIICIGSYTKQKAFASVCGINKSKKGLFAHNRFLIFCHITIANMILISYHCILQKRWCLDVDTNHWQNWSSYFMQSFHYAHNIMVWEYTNTTWLEGKYGTIHSRGTDNEPIIKNPQGEWW